MLDFGYYNIDCMDGMKQFPDKYFDLAIVDPPYFTGPEKRGFYGRKVSPIGGRDMDHSTTEKGRELAHLVGHKLGQTG